MPEQRVYTVAEANALLPRLRDLLQRIQAAEAAVRDGERLARLKESAAGNGGGEHASRVLREGRRLGRLIAEVEALGVVVRDAAGGLVDFPGEREGRPIYLCWRVGEPEVRFWHDRDSGYIGRQPL